jgi:hypothetical protein
VIAPTAIPYNPTNANTHTIDVPASNITTLTINMPNTMIAMR